MQNAQIIQSDFSISGRKILWTILSAMVVGAVGGVFGALRIVNTDHFIVLSHASRLEAIEKDYVKRETYQLQYSYIIEKLEAIDKKIDKLH